MAGSDLGRRLAVAGVGVPLGVLVIYLGVWPVALLLSAFAALAAREVYLLSETSGCRPFRPLGITASALLVLSAARAGGVGSWSIAVVSIVLGLTLLTLASSVFLRTLDDRPLTSVATTVFGAIYPGITLGFGVHLRAFPGVADGQMGWDGALILIFPLTVTWIGDSAAYFSGRRWGRTKLRPAVSPGKTVAGGVGGLLGAIAAAMLFAGLLINAYSDAFLPSLSAAVIGLVLGCAAQVGDLAESLLKRGAGVKDSGGLFPGHGGVLDRFDSVLFTLPATYTILILMLAR